MFLWQEQYLMSECSERVRYCSCHSNIKFISSRHHVISSIYFLARYHVALRDIVSCQRYINSALRHIIPALQYIVSASRYVSFLLCDILLLQIHFPKIIYDHNDEPSSLRSQLFEMASGELNAFNAS